MRTWRLGGTVILFLGVLAGGAAGEEPAVEEDPLLAKVAELEKLVAEHGKAHANEALVEDAKATASLHDEVEGKEPHRTRLVKLLGTLTKEKSDAVKQAAIVAIGETGDPEAGKHLKSFLKPVTDGAVPTLTEVAVVVAAKVPHDSLVEPLLKVVEDSKAYGLAAKAMESLGAFGKCKRKRERILEDLVKTVERVRPGGPPRGKENQTNPDAPVGSNQGGGAAERWGALAPVLPGALNRLTGRNFATLDDWVAMVKENKRDLGKLFRDED